MLEVIGIIPARYGSSRFPGKPLAPILGKSLIQRTYENASRCTRLEKIIVATDDQRVADHVRQFGGEALLTSEACHSGTDRIAEVIGSRSDLSAAKAVINIQGDEPTLDPHVLETVANLLLQDSSADVATALVRIKSEEEALNPSVVKCVVDNKGFALYFSRSLIPGNQKCRYNSQNTYYKHLGIYGYRPDFLLKCTRLPPSPLQRAEDLEQLKFLENGFRIKTALVEGEWMDVNTPEDIKKVEKILCQQNSFS